MAWQRINSDGWFLKRGEIRKSYNKKKEPAPIQNQLR